MRVYYITTIKTFPIIKNSGSSKKYYNGLKELNEALLLARIDIINWVYSFSHIVLGGGTHDHTHDH